jgi:hypothetical protein
MRYMVNAQSKCNQGGLRFYPMADFSSVTPPDRSPETSLKTRDFPLRLLRSCELNRFRKIAHHL